MKLKELVSETNFLVFLEFASKSNEEIRGDKKLNT